MGLNSIKQWLFDWCGKGYVEKKTGAIITPFATLQQVLVILALIFSDPLLSFIGHSDQSGTLLIPLRITILLGIILMANYMVVAKYQAKPSSENATNIGPQKSLQYKYKEGDRLTAKVVLPSAIVIMIILSLPQPKPCALTATLHFGADSHSASYENIAMKLEGNGMSDEKLFSSLGIVNFEVLPDQINEWTISIMDGNGKN